MKRTNCQSKKCGFTLVELLIASAIFVVVMVIVTGIFSMAASYNGKLREMRNLSLAGRSIMEQLSTDVRLANGSLKSGILYLDSSSTVKSVIEQAGEISMFTCSNDPASSGCWKGMDTQSRKKDNVVAVPNNSVVDNWITASKNNGASDGLNNSLLILQQKQNKIIFYRNLKQVWEFDKPYTILKRYEYPVTDWPNSIAVNDIQKDLYKNFDNSGTGVNPVKDYNVFLNFQGYGPSKDQKRDSQPYVQAALSVATYDYEHVQPSIRARFDLITTIETRDYN